MIWDLNSQKLRSDNETMNSIKKVLILLIAEDAPLEVMNTDGWNDDAGFKFTFTLSNVLCNIPKGYTIVIRVR